MMLILVYGEPEELDADYLFNRSLCLKEDEDEGWVLTKSYCTGPYSLFSGDVEGGQTWWIKGSAAYTLASACVI
jgi:hypothetical protein